VAPRVDVICACLQCASVLSSAAVVDQTVISVWNTKQPRMEPREGLQMTGKLVVWPPAWVNGWVWCEPSEDCNVHRKPA